ncbi:MAG: hypothetical protein F6K42_34930 [Leptolyngbya sp. SIO1D8]|nr:hypothetical protein [Leptolyngbya sp. SIO1D8]
MFPNEPLSVLNVDTAIVESLAGYRVKMGYETQHRDRPLGPVFDHRYFTGQQ